MEEKDQKQMVADIAENIKKISDSVAQLLDGPLEEKTIFVLLAHSTKLPQSTIKEVLYAAYNMDKDYLKSE